MPIPKTRSELTSQLDKAYDKLTAQMETLLPDDGTRLCIGTDWTVAGMLAVRVWWLEAVMRWIDAGRRGETPVTPKQGYKWNETPRLNADIVSEGGGQTLAAVRAQLDDGVSRLRALIADLNDDDLLTVGVFPWAGKWPVSRWISVSATRQFETAAAMIRKTVKAKD